MSIARTVARSRPVTLASATALALCLGLAGGDAIAGVTQSTVRGRIADVGEGRINGAFKLTIKDRTNSSREALIVKVKRLDVGDSDELPTYDVWLIDEDGALEADFGDLRLNSRGRGRLRWKSGDGFPDDVDSLRDFSGGTIEIRDDAGDAVADGNIRDFLGLEDDNEPGSHARTRGRDKENLTAADEDSDAKGRMKIRYVNAPGGVRQSILLKVVGLAPGDGPYTAVAIDDEDTETEIGEFDTFTRAGVGGLRIHSADGDDIPGDNVNDLAGQDVEVRAEDGTVVLTGTFPEI